MYGDNVKIFMLESTHKKTEIFIGDFVYRIKQQIQLKQKIIHAATVHGNGGLNM